MSSPHDGPFFPRHVKRSSLHTRIPSVSSRPSTPTSRPYSSTPPQSPRPSSLRTVSTPPPSPSKSLQRIHARRLAGLSTPSISTMPTSDTTERSASRMSRSASTRSLRSFIPEPYRRHAHSSSASAVSDAWIEAAAAEEDVGKRGRFVQRVRSALNLKPRESRADKTVDGLGQRVQRKELFGSGSATQERLARSESAAKKTITEHGYVGESRRAGIDLEKEGFQRGNRRRRSPASENLMSCGVGEAGSMAGSERTETGLGRFKRRRIVTAPEDIPLFGYPATESARRHVSLRLGYERPDTSFVNHRRGSMAPTDADMGESRIETVSRYVSSIPRYERVGSNVLNRRRDSTALEKNATHRLSRTKREARPDSPALDHEYSVTIDKYSAEKDTENTIEDDEIDCLVQLYTSEDQATTNNSHTSYSAQPPTPKSHPSQATKEPSFSLAGYTEAPQTNSPTYRHYPTPSHSEPPSPRKTPTPSRIMHTDNPPTEPCPHTPLLPHQTPPLRSSLTFFPLTSTEISPKLVVERPPSSLPSRHISRIKRELLGLHAAEATKSEPTASRFETPPSPLPLSLSPVVCASTSPTAVTAQPPPPPRSLAISPVLCKSTPPTRAKPSRPQQPPCHPSQKLSLSAIHTTFSISPIPQRSRRPAKKTRPSAPVRKLEPSPVKLFAPYTVSRSEKPLSVATAADFEIGRNVVQVLLLVCLILGAYLGFQLRVLWVELSAGWV